VVLSVDRANFVEKRTETGDLFPGVFVVGVLNVCDYVRKWLGLPVSIFLRSLYIMFGTLQRIQNLIDVQVRSAAAFLQSPIAATAIVDA
jgi:hypothetical protein